MQTWNTLAYRVSQWWRSEPPKMDNSKNSSKDKPKDSDDDDAILEFYTATKSDEIKSLFVTGVSTYAPFGIAVLLAISNGYFFAGSQNFSLTNTPVFLAWSVGVILEAITLASLFYSSMQLKASNNKAFIYSLLVGLVLASISFLAQYIYLQGQYNTGVIQVDDASISKMPIVSLLVGINGLQGHDVLFLIRSGALHLGEIACTFLLTRKGLTAAEAMRRQREQQEYRTQVKQSRIVLNMLDTVTESQNTMMKQQNEMLKRAMDNLTREQKAVPIAVESVPEKSAIDKYLALPTLEQVQEHPKADFTKALLNQVTQQS